MEIIKYTEKHKEFRGALRSFLEKEVTPHADAWEEEGIVPRSIWKKMGEHGFLCMDLPQEYGGAEADFLYSVIVTEELRVSYIRQYPHEKNKIFTIHNGFDAQILSKLNTYPKFEKFTIIYAGNFYLGILGTDHFFTALAALLQLLSLVRPAFVFFKRSHLLF